MSHKKSKTDRKLKTPQVFAEFQKTCLELFWFLVDDYGFEYVSTDSYSHECSILFRAAPNVAIRIYDEVGGMPWAQITGRVGSRTNPNKTKEFVLDSLIRKRCPGFAVTKCEHKQCSEVEVREILQQYAVALRKYGDDVLHGDFSRLAMM